MADPFHLWLPENDLETNTVFIEMRRILVVRNVIRRASHSHSPTFYRARDFAQQKTTGIYFTELIQETKRQTLILEDIRTTLEDIGTTTEDIGTTAKSSNDAVLCVVAILAKDLK
jgi:hypothetical protein